MPTSRLTIASILQATVRFMNTFKLRKSFKNLLLKFKNLRFRRYFGAAGFAFNSRNPSLSHGIFVLATGCTNRDDIADYLVYVLAHAKLFNHGFELHVAGLHGLLSKVLLTTKGW